MKMNTGIVTCTMTLIAGISIIGLYSVENAATNTPVYQQISVAAPTNSVVTLMPTITFAPTPTPKPTTAPTPTLVPCNSSEVTLLAKLIVCEAGYTDIDQMYAVGQVVINRMNYFELSLHETVYEPGTFSPVRDGSLKRRTASDTSTEIARQLLTGYTFKDVKNALYFCSLGSYKSHNWHYKASHQRNPELRYVCIIGGTIFFELI